MASWFNALRRTRERFADGLGRLFAGGEEAADETTLEDLEACLLSADVPVRLADAWVEELRDAHGRSGPRLKPALRKRLLEALGPDAAFAWPEQALFAVLVVGINGSGKTTTCAKLAHRAAGQGRKPLLAAADTFRAAGADQLKQWADRLRLPVVGGQMGADAAAVAYDALDAALARNNDTLIVDTAGRMHTREPLMRELTKVREAMRKRLPEAPHAVWMVLDATLGHNALLQAKAFHEAVRLDGVIVSKLDGSSKAGFVLSIRRELHAPILFAGLGEGEDDLVPFEHEAFADALLAGG